MEKETSLSEKIRHVGYLNAFLLTDVREAVRRLKEEFRSNLKHEVVEFESSVILKKIDEIFGEELT